MTFVKESKESLMEEKETLCEDSEAEEALSLCDLPISGDLEDHSYSKQDDHQRRSSDQEFFEFFNDLNSEMRAAEDIIFCGKLLPYRSSPPLSSNHHHHHHHHHHSSKIDEQNFDFKKKSFFHRKSDSMSDLQRSQSGVKSRFMRNSYSFDYRKLNRDSSSKIKRSSSSSSSTSPVKANDSIPSGKCFGKYDFNSRSSSVRPRRNLFTFGLMKTPPEMELRDIRNRQNRKNPSSMFPMFDREETVSVKRDGGKGSWSLFRALGCKGHANAVVTSLRCIPQV